MKVIERIREMHEELAEAIRIYAVEGSQRFHTHLSTKSRDELQDMLAELIKMYLTDKNSSTLREILTAKVAGYEHSMEKIGYNGFKEEAGKRIMCEIKPLNVDENERKKSKDRRKKLNGGGNFTDYTWERFKRDQEENLNMLVSGFVSGKLIYVLEFPFDCASFKERIKEQLGRRLPEGDRPREYARSVNFTYKNYKDCAKLIYLTRELDKYKDYLTKPFYKFLRNLGGDDGN